MKVSRPFVAEWAYVCEGCGEKHLPGTMTRYTESKEKVRVGCESEIVSMPSADEQEQARRQRCERCFLMHAQGQQECW